MIDNNDLPKKSEYETYALSSGLTDKAENSSFQEAAYAETSEISNVNGNDSRWKRFKDSMRRQESPTIDPNLSEAERAELLKLQGEGTGKLKKSLKRRHLFMISIATGIGTGLLVGSATSLSKGGPAGLLIGVVVISTMLVNVMEAAGEMAVTYGDLSGGFSAYSAILIEPCFTFAVSWNYCIQWLCVMPLELVTATITIKYWNDEINSDAWVVIFYVVIVVINFCGSAGYGEAEFFFNTAKVLMISGFIILSIIITCGGAGTQGFVGGKYWHHPGAFADSFKGVCAVFVNAAFAFGGTELLALSAAEQANPRFAIPSATKQVVYRAVFLYVLPLMMIGFLVPYNSSDLLGSTGASKTHSSPFVIAVSTVRVVPHIVNAVILLAVLSVGNSALFASSRTLQSLAEQGFAPRWFDYIDRTGKPLRALIAASIIGIFSFIAAYEKEETVFNWLLAISGLSTLFTWGSIVLSHIRFRAALKAQGHSLSELGYRSKVGTLGSWYAFIMIILVFIAQFWIALWPVGEGGAADAENFFENYLGFIVCLAFYIVRKVYTRTWRFFIPADEIDLTRGRKIFDADILAQEDAEELERLKNSSWLCRVYKFWC